jgi:tripartite-type tricarboxylate transporter receptor subunit TctC
MGLSRRSLLGFATGVVSFCTSSLVAKAQAFPTRPVRLIVPFQAGGSVDIIARLMGQWLSERLRHPFFVDNRTGANGNVGTLAVVRAPPDGYTLLMVTAGNASSAALYDNLNFDFLKDITPVASIDRVPNVMEVHPSVPAKTVPELIAYAKANPGKLNMASAGVGSIQHISGELFKLMAGVNMLHVPYRGAAPALADLLGGQVQVMFDNLPSSIDYIRSGRLRALAVTTTSRFDGLPEVPSLGELLPGYESSAWAGIGAPKNTSAEIVEKLNAEINVALADATINTRLASLGATPNPGSPPNSGHS